jgi:hypothetical protein
MLPTLRLLIAAMLATVVVLICGFGIFAAFRVSRDPIAHLPAAAVPLQMIAEAGDLPVALPAAQGGAEELPQSDVSVSALQESAPAPLMAEQHPEADRATRETADARPTSATADAEPRADRQAENELVASTQPEQPTAMDSSASSLGPSALPPESGAKPGDIAPDAASDIALPRPSEAAERSITAHDQAIDAPAATAAADEARGNQPTFAQTPPGKAFAALSPDTDPAPIAAPGVRPENAPSKNGAETPAKPRPVPARRSLGHAVPALSRDEPARRVERPARSASAAPAPKPKRARVAVARPARTIRFTASYESQYTQSAEQSYGYGQGDTQGTSDQQRAAVRYVVRPRAALLAARKVNAAVGGPFVRPGAGQ